ncbi:MAG: type II toxin-antitoxin system VapC family toxin [Thermoanaerobaculia bacterium]|nr:type II toxin-antitoxin system VapC family toxin [Thermoanaerobaculia bacterium]
MPGRYLLDTNAVIDLFAPNEELLARLEAAEAVFLSTIVLGELNFGAEKSHRVAENHARIESFAAECTVLAPDVAVARDYGRVKKSLKSRGRPIPENDVWIAATALIHGLTVLSRDHHLDFVDGLERETWR